MSSSVDLGEAPTLPLAFASIGHALTTLKAPEVATGLTRLEVEVSMPLEPALWLAHQRIYPRVYFSNQHKSLRVAGIVAAERLSSLSGVQDASWTTMFRILDGANPRTRFYGGMRFDSEAKQQQEWAEFGGSMFILPMWELQVCDCGRCYLACHLRWSPTSAAVSDAVTGLPNWEQATREALNVMQQLHYTAEVVGPMQQVLPTLMAHEGSLTASDWADAVKKVLKGIDDSEWSKVVLAQRVNLHFNSELEPMHLLLRLLEADDAAIAQDAGGTSRQPGTRHAYLFLLQPTADAAFMGCTPEKLFQLQGDKLSTEALAGTRPRGSNPEADQQLAQELLHCEKDLREVTAVRDFLVRVLKPACEELDHSAPFVLQLRHVQHICVPFFAKLTASADEHYQPVLSALSLLHPTPAVCGAPSAAARRTIRELERFDRGFYAGPLGCVSSDGCEFCVAIRSALLHGKQASIYAGAGIVRGSTAVSEWEEVHVKMKNFVALFPSASHPVLPAPSPFLQLPNYNAVHAAIFLEELLRSGLGHVILCPGSRCAPLTVAVAQSGCAHTLTTDERGAGFMALGFARTSGRCAAVVVSSGTAVANLLPAAVEASQVPHAPSIDS
jgi:menaquinone-specific isochorismate synthase